MKTTYGLRLEDLNTCRDFKKNSAREISDAKKKKKRKKDQKKIKIMVDHQAAYVTLPGCADTVNRCVQS